jgi:hypothetical protein
MGSVLRGWNIYPLVLPVLPDVSILMTGQAPLNTGHFNAFILNMAFQTAFSLYCHSWNQYTETIAHK